MGNKHIIMLLLAVIIVAIPFFLFGSKDAQQGYFNGSDDKASQAIEQTGYHPWFSSVWTPPSSEMEGLLFSLQAAIGALIIGYFIGYYSGRKKDEKN